MSSHPEIATGRVCSRNLMQLKIEAHKRFGQDHVRDECIIAYITEALSNEDLGAFCATRSQWRDAHRRLNDYPRRWPASHERILNLFHRRWSNSSRHAVATISAEDGDRVHFFKCRGDFESHALASMEPTEARLEPNQYLYPGVFRALSRPSASFEP